MFKLVEDFTGFMLDERPEPLPIGKEASDNVAQLAGWNKVILYYVTIIEG